MTNHRILRRMTIGAVGCGFAAAAAIGGAGGAAALPGLPDLVVTKSDTPASSVGCAAKVTNTGGATAKNVTVRILPFVDVTSLGDIAPGESKQAEYIDCAFVMGGMTAFGFASNGDSNWTNNIAVIFGSGGS